MRTHKYVSSLFCLPKVRESSFVILTMRPALMSSAGICLFQANETRKYQIRHGRRSGPGGEKGGVPRPLSLTEHLPCTRPAARPVRVGNYGYRVPRPHPRWKLL